MKLATLLPVCLGLAAWASLGVSMLAAAAALKVGDAAPNF